MSRGGNFVSRLSPLELSSLERRGRVVSYSAGEQLMRQGDEGDCVIILHSGFVKIVSRDADGHDLLLGMREPAELLGEMACLDNQPRSASVVAAGPVSGVKIARSRFLGYLDEFPRVAREVIRQVSERLRAAEDHHMALMAADVDTRILLVLADMCALFAPRAGQRKVIIPLNQPEVSQLAAVSVPTVERSLRRLRGRKLVGTGYGCIKLPCADCLRRAASPENIAKPIRGCGGFPPCPPS